MHGFWSFVPPFLRRIVSHQTGEQPRDMRWQLFHWQLVYCHLVFTHFFARQRPTSSSTRQHKPAIYQAISSLSFLAADAIWEIAEQTDKSIHRPNQARASALAVSNIKIPCMARCLSTYILIRVFYIFFSPACFHSFSASRFEWRVFFVPIFQWQFSFHFVVFFFLRISGSLSLLE